MTWSVTRNKDGEYECHDGQRLRALIVRRPKAEFQWVVYRVNHKGKLGGADTFPRLSDAKDFVTNRPGIWGV